MKVLIKRFVDFVKQVIFTHIDISQYTLRSRSLAKTLSFSTKTLTFHRTPSQPF